MRKPSTASRSKPKSANPKRSPKGPVASAVGPSPFLLYEHSVQSPDWQVNVLPGVHRKLVGTTALRMREDFCGSGQIACAWAKKSAKHFAVGLDLDPAALAYAESVNRAALGAAARERVRFIKQDVLRPTREKFDFIGAYNFSFFDFHERSTVLRYARSAYASLADRGTFFLELGGGDGFMETFRDTRRVSVPGVGEVRMVWEQHQYDPITAVNDFSIHFRLPNGEWMSDAFRYHWRLWGIRDMREILAEAGFPETVVLWGSLDDDGEDSGVYVPTEQAEYRKAWIAYVVGVKKR